VAKDSLADELVRSRATAATMVQVAATDEKAATNLGLTIFPVVLM
tara:strand:+ start:342 stop:476 length:135 start_codon:yes stop_codon:yes gene_type:complete